MTRRPLRPALLAALLGLALGHAASAAPLQYRGLAPAGHYLPLGTLGAGAREEVMQADPAAGRLQLVRGDATLAQAFGSGLGPASAAPANVLRLRAQAGSDAFGGLLLRTSAGEQALDLGALREAGALTVVDATLAQGFTLTATKRSAAGGAAPLLVELGHAAVVHVEGRGPGDVVSPGTALLCDTQGCARQAAFAPRGGYVPLQALPASFGATFAGWGNDCAGTAAGTGLALDPQRSQFWCSAAFHAPRARTKAGPSSFNMPNDNPITVPLLGPASSYPWPIEVAARGGLITDVNVIVRNLTHTHPDDLDILLQAPDIRDVPVVLMSDACGGDDIVDYQWTFDDADDGQMTDATICNGSIYRPTDFTPGDLWPAPAPVAPYATTLSTLNGANPIGAWRLWVADDTGGDQGDIEGWRIVVQTGPYDFLFPATGTVGVAEEYPALSAISGLSGAITDVNLVIDGFVHNHPDDVDIVLESPSGTRVLVLSDACGADDITNFSWRFDDEASFTPGDDSYNSCLPQSLKPANYGAGDSLPAPAPAPPYAAALSAFDGEDPNGDWKLWIADDGTGDGGFLVTGWSLEILTAPLFSDGFESP